MKKPASATDPLWYKDAIIYELHVRAFSDSNGDGIGDFPGLLSKLDYLQDLGVTCIWLLPFFPSPLRDDGYDIANYVDVNPSYGTLNDFKLVLDAAHERNMQVMIELVINHTSDQHPWFKAARLAPPGSPERAMYVWSDTDQLYKDARIIFTDTEKSNWTWDETAKAYYWHRFFSHQPDLNFDNPRVMDEVLKSMRFWLDMGVDALRMDAIPYLVERDGTSCENLPETHAAIKAIRAAIDAEYSNRLILAEANQWPADVRPYFGDGDECHMAFHFPLMPRIYMALRQEDRLPITDIMAQTPEIPNNCQWGLFLRNHDELTLEMVTDDERDYMYLAYSADPRMRINVGIRRRLAPLVDNNRRRIELLNSLLLSFPGTPIMYYGDEIGMGDNIYLGDRNGVRTPMQWNSDRNAGFSRCDPARLYFPVVMDPIYGYQVVNVEAQFSDQSSLLHWTRNMIALRKLFHVFGRGTLKFYNPANRKVLAYLRDLDRGDGSHETVLCVANLSRFAQPVSLDLSEHAGLKPVEMLGYVPFPAITADPYPLTLAPYSFLWLELQPSGDEPVPAEEFDEPAESSPAADPSLPDFSHGWASLLRGAGVEAVQKALAAWIPRQRWFGAKTRALQGVRIQQWVEVPSGTVGGSSSGQVLAPALAICEFTYASGAADFYQLPLLLLQGREERDWLTAHPAGVIATWSGSAGEVVLVEATASEEFRQSLLRLVESGVKLPLQTAAPLNGAGRPMSPSVPESKFPGRPAKPDESGQPLGALPQVPLTVESPVLPLPLTAQPGEAAAEPRPDAAVIASSPAQLQTRESPSAGNATLESAHLAAHASTAFAALSSRQPLSSRVGSVEQSNTSILFSDRFILKLFRRLQPGENPDVEVGRFLTEIAKFPHVAPFLGEIGLISKDGEIATLAMLQGLVANQGDGWKWFLEQLGSFFTAAGHSPAPESSLIGEGSRQPEHPASLREYAASALRAAAVLGLRTAQMHLAFAMPTEDAAFAPESMTAADLEDDAARIEAQLLSTLEALRARLAAIPDETTADAAALLLSRRAQLLARAREIASLPPQGKRIRIHGDYHLGQTLRTLPKNTGEGDFVLLDFEGEPARSLAERRKKQSPLKDVAGMLRSFSYAANAALFRFLEANAEAAKGQRSSLEAWAQAWQSAVSEEFLFAYRQAIADSSTTGRAILPDPTQWKPLLDAYLLEKALYELLYELNNRVAWLPIPLAGILAL